MAAAKISPNQVQVGYFIQIPLSWFKHPFISNKFKVETIEQVAIIRNLDTEFVYFFPEKSTIVPASEKVLEPEASVLQQRAEHYRLDLERDKSERVEKAKEQRRQIQRTEKAFEQSMVQVRNIMSKINSRPLQAVDEAKEMISQIADIIVNADALVLHMISQAGKEQESLYYHVLNVAMLSMLLAKDLGFTAEQIKLIGLGGLFHDLGKLKVPTQILRKAEKLNSAEANFLKLHPKYGVDLIQLTESFPDAAISIIAQHHELLDGSGYPAGLKAEQIDKMAKVVAVINEFDNLCHPLDISKARSPHHAMSYLFKSMKGKLDATYMAQLIKMMGVYPPGTIIELSDQRIGLVLSVNSDKLLYPNVLIYDPQIPRLEAPVITLEEGKLEVKRVLKPASIPAEVMSYLNPRAQISYYVQSDKS